METEKFTFEQPSLEKKVPPDVTIYNNGLVRFGAIALEQYGLRDAQIVWGESESQETLAIRKESGGRVMRGEHKDTTSCPLRIAVRHVGRYRIECVDDMMVLRPLA